MPTVWFILVSVMIAAYVVLDGFDLGAGIIYLIAGRTVGERRMILRSIGPVWDGNEVWLLAAGGTLYFAYPQLYASAFSGFYLPLMMVLWLLMLRGVGIELRSHMSHPVWQGFFDVIFSLSSVLLAIFFGAALGNVIRGVPLDADGYFFEPLWTNFQLGPHPGILDWYTVLAGVVAVTTLTAHGALYVTLKTDGQLGGRARVLALAVWPVQLLLTLVSLVATWFVRPSIKENYLAYRVREPGDDVHGNTQRPRVARISGVVCVHHGHAGGSGVCPVPGGSAGKYRSRVQPDHLQLGGWAARFESGPGVVDVGDDLVGRLLRVCLPDVPREGAARGRGILAAAGIKQFRSSASEAPALHLRLPRW